MSNQLAPRQVWETGSLPPARAAMQDEKSDKRPSCGYRERVKPDGPKQVCGSEERLYSVSGRGTFGAPKETPVCKDHIEKAYKDWNVDSYRPLEPTSRKP